MREVLSNLLDLYTVFVIVGPGYIAIFAFFIRLDFWLDKRTRRWMRERGWDVPGIPPKRTYTKRVRYRFIGKGKPLPYDLDDDQ